MKMNEKTTTGHQVIGSVMLVNGLVIFLTDVLLRDSTIFRDETELKY